MAKPFDAATKRLIEADPSAWLQFLALPGERAELVDADLSTITAEADRILRVANPNYLAHIELQAAYKTDMGLRTMFYNVVTSYRYRLPVLSIVVLLRREADGPMMSGNVEVKVPERDGAELMFRYEIVRLWEKDSSQILNGPVALLPLAPLTNVSVDALPDLVQRMETRLDAEINIEERRLLWTTTFVLLGLKYDSEFARRLLQGVIDMKESATYQYILEEGAEQGRMEGERRMLLIMGSKRFGSPDAQTQAALSNITSAQRLEELAARLMEVENWRELLE